MHGLDNLRLSLKLLVFGTLLQLSLKLVYTEDDEVFPGSLFVFWILSGPV